MNFNTNMIISGISFHQLIQQFGGKMESNSILVKNVLILDSYKSEKSSVLIENDKISEISHDLVSQDAHRVIDGEGKLLMPGMVNTHTHLSWAGPWMKPV